jgi:hypothetical protein
MLLRDHIINALAYLKVGSPLSIGDLVGEDKFRVHKILMALEREGVVSPSFRCRFDSSRQAANRQLYVPGKVDARDIITESDYVL